MFLRLTARKNGRTENVYSFDSAPLSFTTSVLHVNVDGGGFNIGENNFDLWLFRVLSDLLSRPGSSLRTLPCPLTVKVLSR